MIISSIEIKDFRNYEGLYLEPDQGINIFYGSNAAGKTNILEALYVGCTSASHRAVKDRELIRFGCDEAHIKLYIRKKSLDYRIDMHIKKNRSKGIAINSVPIRKASELLGVANVVFFSPEDLSIIKNGPSERRRFLDTELCQISSIYTWNLISYQKVLNQKNRLLKEQENIRDAEDVLDIYNSQLVSYGSVLISQRKKFTESLNDCIHQIHSGISGGKEDIRLMYEPDTEEEAFEEELKKCRNSELRQRISLKGPHRDDLCFMINNIDARHFGSQGQQRTAALSLKLSEIQLIRDMTGDQPVLLLDDVLAELDRSRQTMLLESIEGIQTMISCTGLDDFVDKRFHIDRLFCVENGKITETAGRKN